MSESLVIWGASGHGRVVLNAARMQADLSVLGFVDDDETRKGQTFGGLPILGGRETLPELLARGIQLHLAVGHCATRARIADLVTTAGFALRSVVHPRSIVADDVSIGAGTFVAAGVVISPNVQVGHNVILNTSCSVDHDSVVGDSAHLAPGARLGGLVQIGRETFVGIGAVILNCIRVGERSIIGGGGVVVRDLEDDVVAYGVPARAVRKRNHND